MNNNPSFSKRQKKWIWNFNAHQTPINLPPSQSHAPPSPVTITASPFSPKHKRVTDTLLGARGDAPIAHDQPVPSCPVPPQLNPSLINLQTLTTQHTQISRARKWEERESCRSSMASTKERDNFVYVAKLAEQAERYEGVF